MNLIKWLLKPNNKHQREMKTPMQELIERLECLIGLTEGTKYEKGLKYAKEQAESMLEKEEALLIKTHGNKKVYNSQIDPTIVTGEEWYTKTFNTKERE